MTFEEILNQAIAMLQRRGVDTADLQEAQALLEALA